MRFVTLTLLAAWGAGAALAADANTSPSIDPETGLASWQTEQQGVQVRLTQISPDQARAFYLARGFAAAAVERYVAECVFMTVVRNVGAVPVEHRLADWRYQVAGQPPRALRSKQQWARLWKQMAVPDPARIAFNWAQIPATQTFAPGDWNQGMTTYAVPRGQAFDLSFVWRADGVRHAATLAGVECRHD